MRLGNFTLAFEWYHFQLPLSYISRFQRQSRGFTVRQLNFLFYVVINKRMHDLTALVISLVGRKQGSSDMCT